MAFLVCLPIAGTIAYLFDKKIEEGIPVAMILATFIAYICGLFDMLSFSPIIVVAFALICLCYCVWRIFKERSIGRLLTFGGVFFLVLGGYYALVVQGRMIDGQDDLMVYGKYVADFYHAGKIISYDYIPGMMIWEYLSESFWPVFSESVLFWAVAMLCVGMMLAIFTEKGKQKKFQYFFTALIVVLLPIITKDRESYFRLQNDFVMGVNMAYILAMYQKAREHNDKYYEYASYLGLAFLTLTKVTGIVFALIMVLLLIGMDAVPEKKKLSWQGLKYVSVCLCSVIVTKLSWTVFGRLHGGSEKFSVYIYKLSLIIKAHLYLLLVGAVVIAVFIFLFKWIVENGHSEIYIAMLLLVSIGAFGCTYVIMPSDIRNDAALNFGNVIFSTYAPDRYFGFGYRFYVPYIVVMLWLMFIWMILQHENVDTRTKAFVIYLNVGFVLFSAFLFLSNFYTRSLSQTARAKECERYLYAYIVLYVLMCLYQFMILGRNQGWVYRIVLAFLTVLTILTANTAGVVNQVFAQDDFYNFDGLNYIEITTSDKFFYVDQNGELNYSRFNYRISPATMMNYYFSDMTIDGFWTHVDEDERYMTVDEWANLLEHYNCTYVYVAATNEEFEDLYGVLFEDDIVDGRIYRVIVDGESVSLKSIEYY